MKEDLQKQLRRAMERRRIYRQIKHDWMLREWTQMARCYLSMLRMCENA